MAVSRGGRGQAAGVGGVGGLTGGGGVICQSERSVQLKKKKETLHSAINERLTSDHT